MWLFQTPVKQPLLQSSYTIRNYRLASAIFFLHKNWYKGLGNCIGKLMIYQKHAWWDATHFTLVRHSPKGKI
jgi:hypothetical protein